MKRVLMVIALASLLLLVACEGDRPEAGPPGKIPQIEIVVPGELPDKPQYEPPPGEPVEDNNTA